MEQIANICVINADFSKDSIYLNRINQLVSHIGSSESEITIIHLAEKEIIPCTGCWGCWVKTPGECLIADDSRAIRKSIINSDLVLFASPLIMAYPSARMKHVMDKMIPLILPYIELVEGENHHEKRYDQYPDVGFLFVKETDTDKEDLSVIYDLLSRFSLNFKSSLQHFYDLDEPLDVIIDAIMSKKLSKIA